LNHGSSIRTVTDQYFKAKGSVQDPSIHTLERLDLCHKTTWLSTSVRQKNMEFSGSWTEATVSLVLQVT